MTLKDLLAVREAATTLYSVQLPAPAAVALRRAIRTISAHLEDYNAVLSSWAERSGAAGKRIEELTTDQREYFEELLASPIEQTWVPPVALEALEEVAFSAAQIDALISAGLVRDDVEPAQVPA